MKKPKQITRFKLTESLRMLNLMVYQIRIIKKRKSLIEQLKLELRLV